VAYHLYVVLMVARSSSQYDCRNMKFVHGLSWKRLTIVRILDLDGSAHKGVGPEAQSKPN